MVRQTGGVAKKEKKMMKMLSFIPSGILGFLLKRKFRKWKHRLVGMQRRKCALEPNLVPWLRMVINKGLM